MAALLLLTAGSARAASNFWVGRGAQAYGQAIYGGLANWNGSSPASGANNTAYFTNTFVNGYACTINTAGYFPLGNIWYNDSADANDFVFQNSPGVILTLGVTPPALPVVNVMQTNRTVTIQSVIAGTNGLAKDGPGTLILTNANTYTGWTVVSNGTLKLATASYATTAVIVNDSTKIGALVTSTDAQLFIPGSWTNADNSALLVDYGTNFPSTAVAAISVTNLSLGTSLTLQVSGSLFQAGKAYPLLTWAGTGPTNVAAFTTLITPPGVGGNFSVANKTLYFNVTSSREPLTWNTGNGVWDTNTSNWLDANLAATAFIDSKDLVVFADASGVTGNPTVTLNSTVSPVSVALKSTSHNYTFSGPGGIGGTAFLTLDAANTQTLTLATTNTYSGDTTINAGTLKIGAANVLPAGTGKGSFTVNSGATLDLNTFSVAINSLNGGGVVDTVAGGSPILTVGANNANSVFSGVLQNTAGSLNLVKNGTGQLVLQTPNTFTGTVTVNGGTLTLGHPDALSTVTGMTLAGGAALLPNMPTGLNGIINAPITLGPSGTTSMINGDKAADATLTLNGPITGGGNLTFQGLNVGGLNPYIVLNAQSTYTGNTLITCDVNGNAGLNLYVQLGIDNALPTNTVLTLDGLDSVGRTVALDLNGFNQTLAGLTSVPRNNRLQQILNSSATPAILTVNNTNNYTFSGQLGNATSANFGLTKNGAGTLTLTGANSYTGPTAINAGELIFSTAGSVATDITVATGATNGLFIASPGAQWVNQGSLAQANNSVMVLNYGATLPSATVAPMQVANLTLGSGLVLQITGSGFVAGQSYPLLNWVGSGPTGASGFTTLVQPALATGNLSVSGSTLYFNVTSSFAPLSWNTGNGTWDTTSTNWVSGTLVRTAYTDRQDLVLFADASGVTGNPTVTLNSVLSPLGVTLRSSSHDYTLSGAGGLAGGAALTLDSANTRTLTLATANTYTGPTTVSGGTLNLSGTISGSSLTISNNAVFSEASTGVIAGSGVTFTQNNPGTNLLTGANTYTGGTTINSGTLQLGDGTSGHDGTLAGSPTVDNYGALVFSTYGNVAYGGMITGPGPVTKNGPGTLTLTNQHYYSGSTTINGGELVGGAGGGCYSSAVTVASPSAALGISLVGSASYWQCPTLTFAAAGTLDFNFGTVTPDPAAYPPPLYVSGDLNLTATPTVIVRGAAIGSLPIGSYPLALWSGSLNGTWPTTVILPPGMAGNLTVSSGQLVLNVTTATAQPFFWATNSGVWDISTSTNWIDANGVAQTYQQNISGGDAVVFNDAASGTGPGITVTLATNVAPVSLTFSNVAKNFTISGAGGLTGSGSVTQVGANTNTLATTNFYTGPTTVSAGTLQFLGSGALSTGTPISLGNATLRIRHNGAGSNGTIAQGNSITLSVAGSTDTIDVGNNGSANTTNTVAFGALNNGTPANAFSSTFNFTGTNGYKLSFSSLSLAGLTGNNTTLNPTTTSVLITGNVMNQESGTVSGHYDTIFLGGTSVGNAINGTISDNANYASVGNGDTRVTMSGTGIWTLRGNSTYHGPTLISAGILEADSSTALGVSAVTMNGGTLSNNVSATLANNVTLTATGTLGVGGGQTLTLSGVVSSTGALTKTGAGALSLTGANTYTGATTLSGGTLQIGGAGSLNSGNYAGNIAIASGTTLKYSSSAAQTLSGVLSGTGLLLKDTGSNTLTLSGSANTFTGSITVNAGTLDIPRTPATLGNVTVAGGAVLQLDTAATNQVGALVLNGVNQPNGVYNSANSGGLIAGPGSLLVVHQDVWSGAQSSEWSTRILSPAKNWTVTGLPTDYAEGDPVTFDDSLTGTSTVNLSVANVSPASVTFNNSKTNYTLQGSASIAGGTKLTMTGTATVSIANTNTYTGATALNAGILQFKGPGALPGASLISPSGTATLQILNDGAGSGGTIAVNNNITLSAASTTFTNSVGNNGGGNTNNTVAFGALKNGATNNAFSSTINFTGANGYLQSFSSLGLSGLTGNGTTLNPTTTSVIIAGNVTNQESGTVTAHFDTLTLSGTSTGNAINGVIADNVNYASVGNGDTRLTKSGTSTWTLTGNNTYHGPTTISAGTLLVNNLAGSGTGASTVTINTNGTLGGTGTIAGVVTNNSGGTLAPGAGGLGTLTASGNLVLLAGSTNTFVVNGSTPANTSIALGGALTYGGVLNIVANGTFTLGQTFTLFSGAGATQPGNFARLQSTGNNNKPIFAFTNGVLSVVPAPPSLTNFYFPGFGYAFPDATGTNFTIVVPGSAAVTALAPTYAMFVGTLGSPASGTTLDFTTPQTYTATAPGGATQAYKLTVVKAAVQTGYQEIVLATGPISYWPLNETSGTTAFDIASGLNNMTYNLATLNQPGLRADGNPSVALLTNNAPNAPTNGLYVGCPFNPSLNPSTFSVEGWILVSNLTAQYLISAQDRPDNTPYPTNLLIPTGGRWCYSIQKNNGGTGFTVTVGNAAAPTSSTSVNGTTACVVGGVYHVVATYDGSTLRLYVNGNLEGSTSVVYQPGTTNDPAFSIGSRFGNTSGDCRMQDVALYGRALTLQEIQTHLMSSPLFQYVNTGTHLIFTWSPAGGTLQGSTNAAGAYNNVPGATSPWTVPITGSVSNAFWRVKF
jgi:autotransporter-associated beta strand protein